MPKSTWKPKITQNTYAIVAGTWKRWREITNEKVPLLPDYQLIELKITTKKIGWEQLTLIEFRYRIVARFIRLPAAIAYQLTKRQHKYALSGQLFSSLVIYTYHKYIQSIGSKKASTWLIKSQLTIHIHYSLKNLLKDKNIRLFFK